MKTKWNRAVSIGGEVWVDGVMKKNFPKNIIPENATGFIVSKGKNIKFISDENMSKSMTVAEFEEIK